MITLPSDTAQRTRADTHSVMMKYKWCIDNLQANKTCETRNVLAII